jgi:hypothetical protein
VFNSWDQWDCETVMVDPQGEVYIVSKERHGHGKVERLPNSAWGSEEPVSVDSQVFLALNPPDNDVVGGDISPDGRDVLLKTYAAMYYWSVPDGNYTAALSTRQPRQVSYQLERQGESVAWAASGNGYYTLAEGKNASLFYYEKL